MRKFFNNFKKSCKRFITGKSGFSLVELIVVIAIMAVMAAVLAPALLGYVEKSRMQKDDSAMGEVTNAIQLSLADQNVYDELLPYAVKGNFSCYADGDASTNININKITTKSPDNWLFNDNCRKLDETPYKPAGKMRGVTITFKPNGSAEYILQDGIVNKIGDDSTAKGDHAGKMLADLSLETVYNRLRSTIGDTIKVSSQTYRNSDYTIFISMGTTGGNQADKQDAIQVYGQYNGTNLSEVATHTAGGYQDFIPSTDISKASTSLADNDWATIRDVIASGKAQEMGWELGSTKDVTINGSTYTATLIGLNHDGNNTGTFMVLSSGGIGQHCMNESIGGDRPYTNAGGWKSSAMREWLNGEIYESMTDVKDYIKAVPKLTNNVGGAKTTPIVSETNDKVFLLSVNEIGKAGSLLSDDGSVISAWSERDVLSTSQEGSPYEWFTRGDNWTNTGTTLAGRAWLRSPTAENPYLFFHYQSSSPGAYFATYKLTVCPAFVIG